MSIPGSTGRNSRNLHIHLKREMIDGGAHVVPYGQFIMQLFLLAGDDDAKTLRGAGLGLLQQPIRRVRKKMARPGGRFQNSWDWPNLCRTATVRPDHVLPAGRLGAEKTVYRVLKSTNAYDAVHILFCDTRRSFDCQTRKTLVLREI